MRVCVTRGPHNSDDPAEEEADLWRRKIGTTQSAASQRSPQKIETHANHLQCVSDAARCCMDAAQATSAAAQSGTPIQR